MKKEAAKALDGVVEKLGTVYQTSKREYGDANEKVLAEIEGESQ